MRRRRWGILLGSAAFHALLVLLFVLDLGRGPGASPQTPMTVWLERPEVRPRAAKPAPRGGARSPATPATVQASPALPSAPPAVSAPSAPAQASVPAPDLRGLGGCRLGALDRLPADARARCQEQLAQAMGAGRAPRPNFDPTGRYVIDKTPYLQRKPHNGCKPMGGVVSEDAPGGHEVTYAQLGIGCAWSF